MYLILWWNNQYVNLLPIQNGERNRGLQKVRPTFLIVLAAIAIKMGKGEHFPKFLNLRHFVVNGMINLVTLKPTAKVVIALRVV